MEVSYRTFALMTVGYIPSASAETGMISACCRKNSRGYTGFTVMLNGAPFGTKINVVQNNLLYAADPY